MIKAKVLETLNHIRQTFYWYRRVHVKTTLFFVSVICKFAGIFLSLCGLRLFIPFLQGILSGDFSKAANSVGLLKFLAERNPQLFDSQHAYLSLILGLILASFLLKSALDYIGALCLGHQIRRAEAAILQILLERMLSLGKAFFDTSNVAGVCHKIMIIPKAVSSQLRSMQSLLSQVMTLVAYVGIMCWISVPLTLATAAIFPIHHFSTAWFVSRIQELSRRHEAASADMTERLYNIFSCIPLVKSYAAEKYELERLKLAGGEQIELSYQIQRQQLLVKPIQELMTMLSLLLVVLIMLMVSGGRDPNRLSSMIVFFFIVRRAMPNFGAVADFRLAMANTQGAFDRLNKLFEEMPDYSVAEGKTEFQQLKRSVELADLSFAYRSRKSVPVLQGVSVLVEKGKMTAIVGATGAGKSTIAQLLMRFYDCDPGAIRIDGVDIREFTLSSLVRQIAYVSQEPALFNDSLRVNVVYGLERDVTETELAEALKKAQLEDLIKGLPEGLETMIGDRGVKLSGGERQRVALARAFLKKAEILILDEATSALDSQTERLIQRAIEEAMVGHTAIVIAHRLSTIANADKVVVIEKGKVVEQGAPRELLAKEGAFYRYWKIQEFSGQSAASAPV